ncbi:MAG: hypothetical protein ACREJ2_04750, partial [Planctomycetota bacterium]
AAQGRVDEALALAEESDWGINDYSDGSRMAFCERILLAAGRREEAYARYCFAGTGLTNNTTIYRRVLEKYPEKEPRSVLLHIMGKVKGKWFAAAKDAGFLDIALECAEHPAADPTTLTRAARDFVQSEPGFALRVAFAAVRGLLQGSGYDPKNGDMYRTYHYGMTAAAKLEKQAEFEQSLKDLARAGATEDRRMMLGALWHCLKRGPADIANTVAIIDMRPPRRGK